MSHDDRTEPRSRGPLLTLEPLADVVRDTIREDDWSLSGLQKTTSYEYDGRWEGESTRSAYLFYHPVAGWEGVSLDVFLDETRRGLTASLTLVLQGPVLNDLGGVAAALERTSGIVASVVPAEVTSAVSLRAALPDVRRPAGTAETTIRVRQAVPGVAIETGKQAVAAVVRSILGTFADLRAHPDVRGLLRLL